MKLYMPTKVYSEKNCVENHSRELAALGTKAMVVTGKHSSRINGSLEDVTGALERERVPYVVLMTLKRILPWKQSCGQERWESKKERIS